MALFFRVAEYLFEIKIKLKIGKLQNQNWSIKSDKDNRWKTEISICNSGENIRIKNRLEPILHVSSALGGSGAISIWGYIENAIFLRISKESWVLK